MKRQVSEVNVNKCSNSYTWIVRKQYSCYGATEYMIEIKELQGCVSYGETFTEAKKGLQEAIELWLKHHCQSERTFSKSNAQVIQLEPYMTEAEFEQFNKLLLQSLLN